MLNILTRTNNRPKYFFSYNESVKNQDYKGTIKQFVLRAVKIKTLNTRKVFSLPIKTWWATVLIF